MGYGVGNKVPQSMLKSLTGAYVPNKVFEKFLGGGKGCYTSSIINLIENGYC